MTTEKKYIRSRNLFNPNSDKPYKLSRSKIELYLDCRLCFYLDRRLGVNRPPSLPFTINSAIDSLLKREFDIYRNAKLQHPIMKDFGIDAIPVIHEELDKWRNNFSGIGYIHPKTNLHIHGAIDDLWENKNGYIIVDYKSTATKDEITDLNKPWHIIYKRQMEIYQWLFIMNNYDVNNTGYFLYYNGDVHKPDFKNTLEFKCTAIPYQGNVNWIDETITAISKCLNSPTTPEPSKYCDFCKYRGASVEVLTRQSKLI